MSHDPHADPDMLRRDPAVRPPDATATISTDGTADICHHKWRWLDRMDVWQCRTCHAVESAE